jgi:hypothetical protein
MGVGPIRDNPQTTTRSGGAAIAGSATRARCEFVDLRHTPETTERAVRDAITGQNDLLEAQEIFETATARSIFGRPTSSRDPRLGARARLVRARCSRADAARRRWRAWRFCAYFCDVFNSTHSRAERHSRAASLPIGRSDHEADRHVATGARLFSRTRSAGGSVDINANPPMMYCIVMVQHSAAARHS